MSVHALTEGIIAVWGSLIRRFPKKHTQKNRYKNKTVGLNVTVMQVGCQHIHMMCEVQLIVMYI